jgi:hypothetical protein
MVKDVCFIFLLFYCAMFVLILLIRLTLREAHKAARAKIILLNTDDWGKENCQALAKGEVKIGMTREMIREAFGSPSSKRWTEDKQERWKYSWICGEKKTNFLDEWPEPEWATNYLTFIEGRVIKAEEEKSFKSLINKLCEPFSLNTAFVIGVGLGGVLAVLYLVLRALANLYEMFS